MIDAEKVGIDCYRKTSAGKWELTAYPEDAANVENPILELVSLDFQCPLALVYEAVEFPQPLQATLAEIERVTQEIEDEDAG